MGQEFPFAGRQHGQLGNRPSIPVRDGVEEGHETVKAPANGGGVEKIEVEGALDNEPFFIGNDIDEYLEVLEMAGE